MATLVRSIEGVRLVFLVLLVATALLACREDTPMASPEADAPKPAQRAPNLVVITLDTTRADALGAYGQTLETSPAFDRLAREGVLFEDALASSPETLPSHATIFTGKQPFAHGVRGNGGYVLANDHLTLAEVLKSAGYKTRAEVAAVVLQPETQITQGFTEVRDTSSEGVKLRAVFREREGEVKAEVILVRDAGDITDSGIQFVRKNKDEKFFLWLHYFNAHAPYSPVAAFSEKIPSSTYHAEVASQDFEMGRFVEALEELGLRDNTLVIITADHGEGLLEHGERTHSYFLYNSTMKVPMLFWGLKGLPSGKSVKTMVRNLDIAPTALDLLGHHPLDDIDGVSLKPLLGDDEAVLSLSAYGEATRITSTFKISPLRYVREGRWKYIHKVNPELYDVEVDPGELENKIDTEPEIAARLHARLVEILAGAPASTADSVVEVTSKVEAQLRALGYVEVAGDNSFRSEGESLEVFGDDPVTKVEDMDLAAWAVGAVVGKRFEAALESAKPFYERNPMSPLAADLYSESLIGLGRWAEAIPVLRNTLEQQPEKTGAREKLITALEAEGKYDDAITELYALNEQRSCHEPTLAMLNQTLHATRRFEEQVGVLGLATSKCPEILANANNYAWALATLPEKNLRDGAKAIAIIRNAISTLGERNPAFLDTLAAGLAEQGNFDDAVEIQTEVIETLRKAGAPEEALREFIHHLDTYRSQLPLRDPAV